MFLYPDSISRSIHSKTAFAIKYAYQKNFDALFPQLNWLQLTIMSDRPYAINNKKGISNILFDQLS